jgi:hypothetical protein
MTTNKTSRAVSLHALVPELRDLATQGAVEDLPPRAEWRVRIMARLAAEFLADEIGLPVMPPVPPARERKEEPRVH